VPLPMQDLAFFEARR